MTAILISSWHLNMTSMCFRKLSAKAQELRIIIRKIPARLYGLAGKRLLYLCSGRSFQCIFDAAVQRHIVRCSVNNQTFVKVMWLCRLYFLQIYCIGREDIPGFLSRYRCQNQRAHHKSWNLQKEEGHLHKIFAYPVP